MRALTLFAAFAGLALAGCEKDPVATQQTDNPEIVARLLATVDGCRLWSVSTGERKVYLARCDAASSRVEWQETETHFYPCGKSTCTQIVSTDHETLSP
ncbi:MAG: hypothetical protein DI527_00435 [Chelatococcus sp.]|nr:MAG: hypothetical protein DI527_00435 [Chelatococcus sp.]